MMLQTARNRATRRAAFTLLEMVAPVARPSATSPT